MRTILRLVMALFILLLAACSPAAVKPAPTAGPTLPALPPEPQRIEFQTEDGVPLVGYYYPAAVNPAPMVVLMHWADGDQRDWLDSGLVSWLQNRGAKLPSSGLTRQFDTPYPFKPLPSGRSFAVFTFDFRGYGESGFSGEWSKYILDAKAAYQTAAKLDGVDPLRVVGIGASIGADAVVDACGDCLAALSLSPGDYLGVPYADAVRAMERTGKTTWCVAAETDLTAFYKCKDLSGDHFHKQIYPSGGHAMRLFRQEIGLQPPIEDVLRQFLEDVFGQE